MMDGRMGRGMMVDERVGRGSMGEGGMGFGDRSDIASRRVTQPSSTMVSSFSASTPSITRARSAPLTCAHLRDAVTLLLLLLCLLLLSASE